MDELIAELDSSSSRNAFVYKGMVVNKEALPTTENIGETYKTLDTGIESFGKDFIWSL